MSDKKRSQTKLNCGKCKKEIWVDTAKLKWGGKDRKCRECNIKGMNSFNLG